MSFVRRSSTTPGGEKDSDAGSTHILDRLEHEPFNSLPPSARHNKSAGKHSRSESDIKHKGGSDNGSSNQFNYTSAHKTTDPEQLVRMFKARQEKGKQQIEEKRQKSQIFSEKAGLALASLHMEVKNSSVKDIGTDEKATLNLDLNTISHEDQDDDLTEVHTDDGVDPDHDLPAAALLEPVDEDDEDRKVDGILSTLKLKWEDKKDEALAFLEGLEKNHSGSFHVLDHFHVIDPNKHLIKDHITKQVMHDLFIMYGLFAPLLALFVKEYLLGTLSIWLDLIVTSNVFKFIESIQYIPIIMNIEHYKSHGDIDDLSTFFHALFHLASIYIDRTSGNVAMNTILLLQQFVIAAQMWRYKEKKAPEILMGMTSFVTGAFLIYGVDHSLEILLHTEGQANVMYRSAVLLFLQVARYVPQIFHNEENGHCAVESLESNLLSMIASAADIYLAFLVKDAFLGSGEMVAFFANAILCAQIILYTTNTRSYLERVEFLEQTLDQVYETSAML